MCEREECPPHLRQRITTNLCLGHSLLTMHSPIGFDLIWKPPSSKLSRHWLLQMKVEANSSAMAHAFKRKASWPSAAIRKEWKTLCRLCSFMGVWAVGDAASKAGLEAQRLTACRSRKWWDAQGDQHSRVIALVFFSHLYNRVLANLMAYRAITCAASEITHVWLHRMFTCESVRVHVCFAATAERANFITTKQLATLLSRVVYVSVSERVCGCAKATCECLNEATVDSCTQRAFYREKEVAVGCRLCDSLSAVHIRLPARARDLPRPTRTQKEHAHLLFIDYAKHA